MSEKLDAASPDQVLVRGEGCWVEDLAGRRLLDARAGVANVILGYGRRDIAEAMYRQAMDLPFGCVIRYSRPALASLRYASELIAAAPRSLTRVRLTHMGSASVENALQMSRIFYRNVGQPAKTWIVSLTNSYHGSTLFTLAASGEPFIDRIIVGAPPMLAHAPMPEMTACPGCTGDTEKRGSCTGELEEFLDHLGPENVAAFIVEPVMEGHVVALTSHYLSELRRLADTYDFLLVFDEVITGFGRLGDLFGADHFKVEPDILCLAKGITSGYAPLGAVLVSERVYRAFDQPGRQHFANGSSTDGHPVSCAAASATLAALLDNDEAVLREVTPRGNLLQAELRRRLADHPLITDIRGMGLLIGIELNAPADSPVPLLARAVEQACDQRGVLVQHGHNLIVLYPPLVISDDEVIEVAERVSQAVSDVSSVIHA